MRGMVRQPERTWFDNLCAIFVLHVYFVLLIQEMHILATNIGWECCQHQEILQVCGMNSPKRRPFLVLCEVELFIRSHFNRSHLAVILVLIWVYACWMCSWSTNVSFVAASCSCIGELQNPDVNRYFVRFFSAWFTIFKRLFWPCNVYQQLVGIVFILVFILTQGLRE